MAIESTPSITSNATAALDLNQLLAVLLTELTHQDPFKPVENKDFMAQIAQFASLDTQQQLNQNILQMLTLQALTQSVGLVGKNVSAITSAGVTINGKVVAVTLTDGVPRMTIESNGEPVPNISLGQIQTIRPEVSNP
ncbi:MAG: flagellar hook capping FlgD N-terminal domain-containing protein [Steroidobacter sp.]